MTYSPKIPPCEQYEPPRNILYTKNKKQFCRVARQGEKRKGPLIPPCNQYGKQYKEYQRLGKTFCRKMKHIENIKKEKSIKDKQKKQPIKKTKVSKKCLNINEKTLKNYAKKMNIDLTKYRDKEWICDNLQSLFDTTEPNIDNVKYLSSIFKIKTRNKTLSTLIKEIANKITTDNNEFNKIISLIQRHQKLNETENHNLIVNSLLSVLFPKQFPFISPIPISEELYNELIQKKISNEYLTPDEKELLDISLYTKYCHCIRKLIFKNKFIKDFINNNQNIHIDINPYSTCVNNIYKQRGFKRPPKNTLKCNESFKWCKDTEYILKQNKKIKYTTKKNKQNIKGGSKPFVLNQSGYIGSYPPSKIVLNNNNQVSCFNDYQTKQPLHFPNRFSCFQSYNSNNNCNQWAGGGGYIEGYHSCNCGMSNQELNLILQESARPSNAGNHNYLNSGKNIGMKMDNNQSSWNKWMKQHDNYYWGYNY